MISRREPQRHAVSVGVLIGASPLDDPESLPGLAHVVEHALFLGTHVRSQSEIYRMMDMAGGQMGAFTARDYTSVYADVLDDYITYAMELIGDVLVNPAIPETALQSEKQVIQRELALSQDSPADILNVVLKASAWSGHPLGRPTQGTSAGVDAITRSDITEFLARHYTPDQMIVAACGSIDHGEFVEQCRDAFWSLSGTSHKTVIPPAKQRAALEIIELPTSQAYFSIGIPALCFGDLDRYSLFTLSSILGGGLSSRLYRQFRESLGLVYSISSEVHSYRDGGMLVIEGATSPDQLTNVVTGVMFQLYELLSGEAAANEEELTTSKMRLRGQQRLAGEALQAGMSQLATQLFYFGRPLPVDEIASGLDAVNFESLNRLSERLLPGMGDMAVAVAGPASCRAAWQAELVELLSGSAAV